VTGVPGAWEVTARYSELKLDSTVFSAGLADPHLWTNLLEEKLLLLFLLLQCQEVHLPKNQL